MKVFRALSLVTLALSFYACGDDDTSTPGGGTATDGGSGTSSSGTTGTSGGTSTEGGTTNPPDDSGSQPVVGTTFIKVDGVLQKGTETYQNANNGSGSGIEVNIGSVFSSDATFLLQVHTDNLKSKSGTFGIEAVTTVQAQLSVINPTDNPKRGLYVTKDFDPATPKDVTFTMSEKDGNKLTFSWKGKMKINGGDTTIEVDVGGTDLTLKPQKQD